MKMFRLMAKRQHTQTNHSLFSRFSADICAFRLNRIECVCYVKTFSISNQRRPFVSLQIRAVVLRWLSCASRLSFNAPRGAAKFKDVQPPFMLITLLRLHICLFVFFISALNLCKQEV